MNRFRSSSFVVSACCAVDDYHLSFLTFLDFRTFVSYELFVGSIHIPYFWSTDNFQLLILLEVIENKIVDKLNWYLASLFALVNMGLIH